MLLRPRRWHSFSRIRGDPVNLDEDSAATMDLEDASFMRQYASPRARDKSRKGKEKMGGYSTVSCKCPSTSGTARARVRVRVRCRV